MSNDKNIKTVVKKLVDKNIKTVVKKLMNIIKYHKIESALDLKEYIYIHNFSEETMKLMKHVFNEYGEINVLNSVLVYCNVKEDNTEKNLIEKIKGIKI